MTRLTLLLAAALPVMAWAHPHHYNEQQVSLTLSPQGLQVEIGIVPSDQQGAEVFRMLDRDGNGSLSRAEMQAFAAEVLASARLSVDGHATALTLVAVNSPEKAEVTAGHAMIAIRADSSLPVGAAKTIAFSIGYDRIDPRWSVQLWIAEGVLPPGQLPVIQRRADNAAVTITMLD